MFYSHEILSNSRYGVATVWLVATVGKGTQRRVTKRAIQEVDVPKACETILDPGAPLALRLQGNLLYGVSRVYAQQCGYVLSDAEKTQSDMMTFFRIMQASALDPQAGKAKRHQITLQDDPTFDPFSIVPNLELLSSDKELFFLASQTSTTKYSQFTPPDGPGSFSSGRNSILDFDLPPSSHSARSYHIPSDFGRRSSSLVKPAQEADIMGEFRPFGEEDFEPRAGIGLDFDVDGNLVGIIDPEEPELPPLPGSNVVGVPPGQKQGSILLENGEQVLLPAGDDNVLIMGEAALPDADAFPVRTAAKRPTTLETSTSETTEIEKVIAKSKRAPRRKYQSMIDHPDHISKTEFRNWTEHYADNMVDRRKRIKTTTQSQAKKNALAFLYDQGLAQVGIFSHFQGTEHPLAEQFAGVALKARLQGQFPEELDETYEKRGRRRKSQEAFDEHEDDEQRNVRHRSNEAIEFSRHGVHELGDQLVFGDESAPEIGMEAGNDMDDRHSSSMMPWSRQGSAVPGSSVRAPNSAQKTMPQPSPLLGRGTVINPIERRSDSIGPAYGSDDFGQLRSQDFSAGLSSSPGGLVLGTQVSTGCLDLASQEFLGYAMDQAMGKGVIRGTGVEKRWIDFEQLADPAVHSKAVAAQAFLHVLSLATKNAIIVEQEGAVDAVPYGAIRIGVDVLGGEVSDDELA